MRFVDKGDKIILRDTVKGEERSVGFIEYREHADEGRVVTGVIEALPHLDPYETGAQLLTFLREKYPRPDWSLETEPKWCRAEYLALIQRGIESGLDFYDVIGESVDGPVELTEQWEYAGLASGGSTTKHLPTVSLLPVMEELDGEANE